MSKYEEIRQAIHLLEDHGYKIEKLPNTEYYYTFIDSNRKFAPNGQPSKGILRVEDKGKILVYSDKLNINQIKTFKLKFVKMVVKEDELCIDIEEISKNKEAINKAINEYFINKSDVREFLQMQKSSINKKIRNVETHVKTLEFYAKNNMPVLDTISKDIKSLVVGIKNQVKEYEKYENELK